MWEDGCVGRLLGGCVDVWEGDGLMSGHVGGWMCGRVDLWKG